MTAEELLNAQAALSRAGMPADWKAQSDAERIVSDDLKRAFADHV